VQENIAKTSRRVAVEGIGLIASHDFLFFSQQHVPVPYPLSLPAAAAAAVAAAAAAVAAAAAAAAAGRRKNKGRRDLKAEPTHEYRNIVLHPLQVLVFG
jgi:hypothetical protein